MPNTSTPPSNPPLAAIPPVAHPSDGFWWKIGLVLAVGGALLYYGGKQSAKAYR